MKKILILDDNRDILDIVVEILSDEQLEVQGINMASELMPKLETFYPDLILLDFRLEDGHGGEICLELKSNPKFSSIPVILFTAYNNPGVDLNQYGCDTIIAKPFDISELITTVKALL